MKVLKNNLIVLKITLMTLRIVCNWELRDDEHPSLVRLLPVDLWAAREGLPEQNVDSDCELPMLEDLHYAATSWQVLELNKGSIYFYSAFWDTRYDDPQVIVLAYCDFVPLPQLFCLLWYANETTPTTVLASFTYGWRPEWDGPIDGVNEPYLVSCRVRHLRPAAVSLVTVVCSKPTNLLAVQGSREIHNTRGSTTPSIGVCLKWLRYEDDVSAVLIEWIEILKAFGADTIYIYVLKVHPNTERVLQYYSARGVIDVTPLTLPPQRRSKVFSSEQRKYLNMRHELLPLNDCLYRAVSSGKHQWMANIDLDEIIVPIRDLTWQKLIVQEIQATTKYGEVDALGFPNFFVLDGAQRNITNTFPGKIFTHVWRAREPNSPDMYVKCFHNVFTVIAAHNHYPILCADQVQLSTSTADGCTRRLVSDKIARLYHYRDHCPYNKADCPELHDVVRDDTLARWLSVAGRARNLLQTLNIPVQNKTHQQGYLQQLHLHLQEMNLKEKSPSPQPETTTVGKKLSTERTSSWMKS